MFLALHFTFQGRIYLPGYPLYLSLFQTSPGYQTSSTEFHGLSYVKKPIYSGVQHSRSKTLLLLLVTDLYTERRFYDISSNHRTQILSSGPLKPNWEILHKI
ncbi:hypothetical protein I7I53_10592 [Histoplasma capsulatum var. duboisii H88]|uniref:Uncharacterized protein n=1 Tax=Ajellomyces capsulatus (strain H88) TaxID=544711 RepID=A0A8A1L8Y4_AJEC8|nr:hypothetical protein I7I53_10592 [Histoplasma capsulatum var. duboisii H88]